MSQLITQNDTSKKRSREDRKKEKELEEMRKAGTMPALVDETGKDINPHIPQYIADAPWYIGAEGPTLKHQRPQKLSQIKEEYRKKSVKLLPATKYREGACENCGGMGHVKKDCLERPRKIAAKFSGTNLAADEIILPDAELDYDGKRDRWNGFDPDMYQDVIREFEKVEEAKRLLKEEKLKEDILLKNSEKDKADALAAADEAATSTSTDQQAIDEDEDDEEKYADHIDMPGTKVDSKQRITVRNLRIREDTAKYLRNLDIESAYYDPKTRSMRENPYANTNKKPEELAYAGDNFIRNSGSTNKVYESQIFAWQASEKGVDVNLQAEPTKTELLNKQFKKKKEEIKTKIQQSILDKYCSKKTNSGSDSDEDEQVSVVGKNYW